MTTFPRLIRHLTLAAALSLLCSAAALAANTGLVADAKARYQQDMADCNSGKSQQEPASCRLEARNALAEASRGGLNAIGDQYQQNALKRCAAYQGDDRNDCETRMSSDSNIEGSVGSGGILRKSITIVPAN
jgi:hypothetical protein